MSVWGKIVAIVATVTAGVVAVLLLAIMLFLFVLPLLLLILVGLLAALAYSLLSLARGHRQPGRKQPSPSSTLRPAFDRPVLAPSAHVEGWPLPDADPQASRRSKSAGARRGSVAWSWKPPLEDACLHEPLVTADARSIVVLAEGGERYVLTVLSPEGQFRREIALPHPPWSEPHLGPDNTIFASAWELLLAFSQQGEVLWQQKLHGFVRHLRRTPAGKLFLFTRENGFTRFGTDGTEEGSVYPELGSWEGELHIAFDEAANLYVAEQASWRSDPDELAEQFSRIAAFDAQGKRAWLRNLTAPCASDDPEYTVEHVWGLVESAVFFGDRKIQSYDAGGQLLWEIATPADFEKNIEIEPLGLSLGWDRRLLGGPRLAMIIGNRWEYLECAVDGEGNIYFCRPQTVVALDPDFHLRWSCTLAETFLYGPVIGPRETLLVRSFETLYAIE